MTDPQPDGDDAPRERDVGQGYPEEAPPGTGIDAHEHAEQQIAHEAPDRNEPGDTPDTSKREDGDPSQATGNPRAAGG